jgi:Ser/Thr protein kinase RdoA (MazF antagonist)
MIIMSDGSESAKEELLRRHIEKRYDIGVARLLRLDKGVFALDLRDGRRWVARVFPPSRALEYVEGDAHILQFLEQQGFPAERCADAEPISILYDRGVLVTEYIEGHSTNATEGALKAMGEMLGRLNLVPVADGAIAREAGALHHYSQSGGGPKNDLASAAAWLAAIAARVPTQSRARFESLQEQLALADACHDLPLALIHPDPVLKNVLTTTSNNHIWIDWTGAGRGPRIAALALFIWSGALEKDSWSPQHVDAVVAGYRSQIRLETLELNRLAAVMHIRPLVFACWRFRLAILADRAPDGTEWWWPDEALIQAVAARAVAAFQPGH